MINALSDKYIKENLPTNFYIFDYFLLSRYSYQKTPSNKSY